MQSYLSTAVSLDKRDVDFLEGSEQSNNRLGGAIKSTPIQRHDSSIITVRALYVGPWCGLPYTTYAPNQSGARRRSWRRPEYVQRSPTCPAVSRLAQCIDPDDASFSITLKRGCVFTARLWPVDNDRGKQPTAQDTITVTGTIIDVRELRVDDLPLGKDRDIQHRNSTSYLTCARLADPYIVLRRRKVRVNGIMRV